MTSIGRTYSRTVTVELRHVRYLMAVAEQGSFTRAADVLHVSQPTLSQQIQKLEASLGAALLDRSGRQVRLTDVGAAFLERAGVGLREVAAAERAISDVRDLSRGELRVGMTPTFSAGALAAPLAEFAESAPAIRVTVTTAPQDDLEQRLLDDDLDLALGFAGQHVAGVVPSPLHDEDLHVVIRADRGGPNGDADRQWFAEQRFALLPASFATRAHIDRYFKRIGVIAQVTFEVDSVTTLVQLTKRTTLTTVLPGHAIASESGVRSAGRIDDRRVVVLARDGAYISAAAAAFRRILLAWRPVPDAS